MSDLRPVVERELRRIDVRPFTIEGFHRRRNRKRRNQQLAAAAAGLLVTVVAVGTVVRAFGHRGQTAPASRVTVAPGSIAFVGGRDWRGNGASLLLFDPATGTSKTLVDLECVHQEGATSCPGVRINGIAWSPDGTRIAYSLQTSRAEGSRQPTWTLTPAADGIYVLDLRTGRTRHVTHCERPSCFEQGSLDWSPDGSTIAYTAIQGSTPISIWTMSADGSNRRQLVAGQDPSWSPDGTQIAFSGNHVTYLDGSSSRTLDVDPGPAGGQLWGSSWSPDGSRIAFVERTAGPLGRLWVTTLGAPGSRPIDAFGKHSEVSAASWSPDGTRLAVDVSGWLWVVGADGSDPTKLVRAWSTVAPAWYPR